MCGIAGLVDYGLWPEDRGNVLDHMMRKLRPRGPDQSEMALFSRAALVHTQLAVIKITGECHPMQAGSYTLIYDGELYNTDDIRNELARGGVQFDTLSDTEVVLKSYIQWGERCLERFNGIFAFAVWNELSETLFLARDRLGVKPLFYAKAGDGSFVFGSEIKALLCHPSLPAQIDSGGIAELLLLGPGRTPGCGIFKGIKELLPGQYARYDRKGLDIRTYWRLTDRINEDSFEQTLEKVRFTVHDAIRRRMASDVPLSVFLSGGLDSGIIAAIAGREMADCGVKLNTFSVDYDDNDRYFTPNHFQPDSDTTYTQKMAEHIGCNHRTILLSPLDVADALYEAVDARDLPGMADVDSSLLLFCRKVREHAAVALSGECADDIFGGYPWFRDPAIREFDGFPWSRGTEYRSSFLREEWLEDIRPFNFINQRYIKSVAETSIAGSPSPLEQRMREMMNLNIHWFMQTLLERNDRMSMYSGLKVRVPFCDHRIVEHLYTVPWEFKNHEGREKGLLRKAAEDLLPQDVLWRKKSPYPKTVHPKYLEIVSSRLREVMNDPSSPLLRIVKKTALEGLLSDIRPQPWYGQLMTTPQTIAYFLQINYWMNAYHVEVV